MITALRLAVLASVLAAPAAALDLATAFSQGKVLIAQAGLLSDMTQDELYDALRAAQNAMAAAAVREMGAREGARPSIEVLQGLQGEPGHLNEDELREVAAKICDPKAPAEGCVPCSYGSERCRFVYDVGQWERMRIKAAADYQGARRRAANIRAELERRRAKPSPNAR